MTEPILRVEDLRVEFANRRGVGKAADGVSFEVNKGETLGLVGESGCGKSVTALAVLRLHPQPMARITNGHIWFKGEDIVDKSEAQMRRLRGKEISMVLQDPMTALNPVFTIGKQVEEPIRLHRRLRGKALRERAIELLRQVRIPGPEQRVKNYPHQFSGGMRQRVVSAISLTGEPELLIADEPTTALDVTIQAAYLELLHEIQRTRSLAVLFITHDFGVVGEICNRVAVMYAGKIVETAPTAQVFARASHPYTKALLESVPDVRQGAARLASIQGAPPSIYDLPTGCRFHPRCWLYELKGRPERCVTEVPEPQAVDSAHTAACHFPAEAAERKVPTADRQALQLTLTNAPSSTNGSKP